MEVAKHVDGDTLWLEPKGRGKLESGVVLKVRLLEIDTPEIGHFGAEPECFGQEATDALARMLPIGATAYALPDEELLDRYDRTLLYLWTDDGVFVNERLVEQGYATAVLYEPNDLHIDTMRAAEQRARKHDRGIWGACN